MKNIFKLIIIFLLFLLFLTTSPTEAKESPPYEFDDRESVTWDLNEANFVMDAFDIEDIFMLEYNDPRYEKLSIQGLNELNVLVRSYIEFHSQDTLILMPPDFKLEEE